MKENILRNLNKILEEVRLQKNNICDTLNNSTNVKLHDVARLDNLDMDTFNNFCYDEYENWSNFLKENYLEETHIGRTSTFYLTSPYYDMYKFDYHGQMNIKKVIYLICEYSGLDTDCLKINNEGVIEELENISFVDGSEKTWEEYFLENYTLEDIYRDLESEVSKFFEELDNIKKGYEYLEDFKENQVDIYNDYLGCLI